MREKAAPKLLLSGASGPVNLTESTRQLLNQEENIPGRPGNQKPGPNGGAAPKKLDPSVGGNP